MPEMFGVQGIFGIPQPINEPAFTLEERDRRWAAIRSLMEEASIDVLIVLPGWMVSDALYIADAPGVTIFPREEEPTLILGGEASHYAVRQPSWIDDRLSATEYGSPAVPYGKVIVEVLARRGLLGRNVAVAGLRSHMFASVRQVDGYASYTTVNAIAEATSQPICDGTGLVAEARYVKSQEEIGRIAAAQRIAERSAARMLEVAAEGIAQAEVFAQMLAAQVQAGADGLYIAWAPGQWGEHRHRYVTTPPGVLSRGTYVTVELMPDIRGYQGQVCQPFVIGEPASEAAEIFHLNGLAFDRAMELLRVGNTFGEIEDGVRSVADGTQYQINLTLHGRGLGHDGPLFIPAGPNNAARKLPVTQNTVFVLKPSAVPREGERQMTRAFNLTWGDAVAITGDGAKRLGTRVRELPTR